MPSVEAVVINCFRPENVRSILAAIQPQVELTTVLDCSVEQPDWASDRTVRLSPVAHDPGPWVRYAPNGLYEHDFTLLIDDDLLPHPDMVSRFLDQVGQYDVIGAMGRVLTEDGGYKRGNAPVGEVDIIVRCYFWRTGSLRETVPKAMARLTLAERWADDDIAMCLALNRKVLVIPGPVPWIELPCPHASSSKPGHVVRRDALCRRLTAGTLSGRTPERA
jgi:hypothetical protein